ncbi:hypothetical protein F5141DRAFT_1066987 [Pisolithus sp. B1]|nr:hypothetical protein F5141DRAFT_1066987 [Pisolithus sp. B1]
MPDRIFTVKIESFETVGILREVIKDEQQFACLANELVLYRTSLPNDGELKNKLQVLDLDEPLQPLSILAQVFTNLPVPGHLHIVIQMPPEAHALVPDKARTDGEEDDILMWMNEMMRHTFGMCSPPPSPMVKSDDYITNQMGDQRILDCRYVTQSYDMVAPPIQLFNPAFAYFTSKKIVAHLIISARNIDRIAPDGVTDGHTRSVSLVIYEEKKEFGGGGLDPSIQGSLSYQHVFCKQNIRDLGLATCCPAFIIALAGPWLSILGGITTTRFPEGNAKVQFRYQKPLGCADSCVTYLAKTIEVCPKDIMVKFITRYGGGVHHMMADAGFAPTLHYFGPLSSGENTISYSKLKMVVMDHVRGLMLLDAFKWQTVPTEFPTHLQQAVAHLHGAGFVFGDLREPNILVTPGDELTVRLINFDWAGKDGEVVYPISILPDVRWPTGVVGLMPIEKQHDLSNLERIIRSIETGAGMDVSVY